MQSLTKSELAWQFSPNVAQTTALNRLSRWIKGDEALLSALYQSGYHDNQRVFTTRQVSIIYNYLGNPIAEQDITQIM